METERYLTKTQIVVRKIASSTKKTLLSNVTLVILILLYLSLIISQTILYTMGNSDHFFLPKTDDGWKMWYAIYGTGFAGIALMLQTRMSAVRNKNFIYPNLTSNILNLLNSALITGFWLDLTKWILFIFISIARYIFWIKEDSNEKIAELIRVKRMKPWLAWTVFAATILAGVLFGWMANHFGWYGDSKAIAVWSDGIHFILAIIGGILIMLGYYEGWLFYFAFALPAAIMFIYLEQWSSFTTILIMAFVNFGTAMTWLDKIYQREDMTA